MHQPVSQGLARCEQLQPGNAIDKIALTVDDNDRGLTSGHRVQIMQDEMLDGLGFAVAGARHDVVVFKPGLGRQGDGKRIIKQLLEGCAVKIGRCQFLIGNG